MRCAAVACAAVLFSTPAHAMDLDDLLRDARSDPEVVYVAPSVFRLAAERSFFQLVFRAAAAGDASRLDGRFLGFDLHVLDDELVITEAPEQRRGAGAWVVRIGEAREETFVQAPHTFSDMGSAPIALELYRALGARALAIATVHRRETDIARNGQSTFHMATLAWLASGAASTLIQVHGFKDETAAFDLVLSAGEASDPPAWLKTVKSGVAKALPDARVALFPDDVDVLGATTNVQGAAARSQGARFLHMELGASLRGEVRESKRARRELARALAAGIGAPERR